MDRFQTIELWLRCQNKALDARNAALAAGKGPMSGVDAYEAASEEWNAWAHALLAEKRDLEAKGTWESTKADWIERACADFCGVRFFPQGFESATPYPRPTALMETYQVGEENVTCWEVAADGHSINFMDFVFPSGVLFDGSIFRGRTKFDGGDFHGWTSFRDATFYTNASFTNAHFHKSGFFLAAQFEQDALFSNVTFDKSAIFEDVRQHSPRHRISFNQATFSEEAEFERFQCRGNASFFQATFEKLATFKGAKFGADADFTAVSGQRGFILSDAEFTKIPKFNQASFDQAPDLDGIRWPMPRFFRKGSAEDVAKYRALKRIASQGHDHEREYMAFKGELRSRRLADDTWPSAGLWLGGFYDLISDCGMSVWRPFVAWIVSVVVFAAFFLSVSNLVPSGGACSTGNWGREKAAAYVSLKNGFVVFDRARDDRISQAYQCLYGGKSDQLKIPLRVSVVETLLQTPVSALLLFLILLAIRNRFRIK